MRRKGTAAMGREDVWNYDGESAEILFDGEDRVITTAQREEDQEIDAGLRPTIFD